jgi:hypothetical protein
MHLYREGRRPTVARAVRGKSSGWRPLVAKDLPTIGWAPDHGDWVFSNFLKTPLQNHSMNWQSKSAKQAFG